MNKIYSGNEKVPPSVPFMLQYKLDGTFQGQFSKGGLINLDGKKHKIMAIRKVEIFGKVIKVIGTAKLIDWKGEA